MIRVRLNIVIALLCAVALLPQAEPKVTLRVGATGLGAIVKQVSEATSVPVITDPQFSEMPVVVSVKDVPLKEFLDKLAVSMDMEARPYGSGFRLMRTVARQAKMEEAERQEIEDSWTHSIVGTRKEFEKNAWSTKFAERLIAEEKKKLEEAAKRRRSHEASGVVFLRDFNNEWRNRKPGIEEHEPAARLAYRVVQAIGAKELSKLPRNRRIVFSRQPTSMQLPMPSQFEQYLAQYIRESSQNPIVETETSGDQNEIRFNVDGGGRTMGEGLERISGPIGKVFLVVESSDSVSATIEIFSKDGQQEDTGQFGSLPFYVPDEDVEGNEPQPEKLKPFFLSPLSKELAMFLENSDQYGYDGYSESGESEDAPPLQVSAELRNALLSPETRDPLAYAQSEAILEYAAQKQVNLIFRPEEVSYWATRVDEDGFDKDGRVKMEAVLPASLLYPPEKPDAPGWVVRPVDDPLGDEVSFLSRRALGKFVRNVAKSGLSLEAECDLAITLGPGLNGEDLEFPVLTLLEADGLYSWFLGQGGFELGQLIGSLTQTQRMAATRNGLVASALTPDQLARLERAVYNREITYGEEDEEVETEAVEEKLGPPGYLNDTTECIPHGLPFETRLTIHTDRADDYRTRDGVRASAKEIAITMLIAQKYSKERDAENYNLGLANMKVKPFTVISHAVSIRISKEIGFTENFVYSLSRASSEYLPVNSPAIRAQLAPWLKRYESYSFAQLQEAYSAED